MPIRAPTPAVGFIPAADAAASLCVRGGGRQEGKIECGSGAWGGWGPLSECGLCSVLSLRLGNKRRGGEVGDTRPTRRDRNMQPGGMGTPAELRVTVPLHLSTCPLLSLQESRGCHAWICGSLLPRSPSAPRDLLPARLGTFSSKSAITTRPRAGIGYPEPAGPSAACSDNPPCWSNPPA